MQREEAADDLFVGEIVSSNRAWQKDGPQVVWKWIGKTMFSCLQQQVQRTQLFQLISTQPSAHVLAGALYLTHNQFHQ